MEELNVRNILPFVSTFRNQKIYQIRFSLK